jgi:DNA-binding XRE family transcriptional regulator
VFRNKHYLCNEQYYVCWLINNEIMNNIVALNIANPVDVAMQIAARVKVRRLELNLTQEGLAARAGVKFATYRRFEQTGDISLHGLLQIGFALNTLSEFDSLFAQKQYQSLDDVLNGQSVTRKRGKKNE